MRVCARCGQEIRRGEDRMEAAGFVFHFPAICRDDGQDPQTLAGHRQNDGREQG